MIFSRFSRKDLSGWKVPADNSGGNRLKIILRIGRCAKSRERQTKTSANRIRFIASPKLFTFDFVVRISRVNRRTFPRRITP